MELNQAEIETLISVLDDARDRANETRGDIYIDNGEDDQHPDVVEQDQYIVELENLIAKLEAAKR